MLASIGFGFNIPPHLGNRKGRNTAYKMDYVLSISDNLFFDYLYAKTLPLQSDVFVGAANSTAEAVWRTIRENDPLSQYLGVEPTKYAVLSLLERDDWRRQAMSLFLITW